MSAVRISVVSVSVALLLTTACLSVREARESGALSARERSKADALAHFSRGLLAEWQGPASVAGTALTEYQAGAVSDPDSADLVCKEAAALMSLGRYDEALSVLQKAAEKLPDSAMVNFGLGRVFGVLTRFPESAEAFLRAAELSHDSAPDMMNCLLMAAASFDNAGGIRGLVNTLELIVGCPDDTLANFIPQDDPESETTPRMIAIGTASEFLVKYASAGRNADAGMLLAFCAANARDATEREEIFAGCANMVYKSGKNPDFAVRLYRMASDENPFTPRAAWYAKVILAVSLKLDETALVTNEIICDAVVRDGENLPLRFLATAMLAYEEKFTEAYVHSEYLWKRFKGLQINLIPEAVWYETIASIRERNGDIEGAEMIFREGIAAHPDSSSMLNYLAYMLAEQGRNLDEAESLVRRALVRVPDNSAFLDTLGWVYYMREDYIAALHWLVRAAELSNDPEICGHLGDVYGKLGREEESALSWAAAYQLDTSSTNSETELRARGVDPAMISGSGKNTESRSVPEKESAAPAPALQPVSVE